MSSNPKLGAKGNGKENLNGAVGTRRMSNNSNKTSNEKRNEESRQNSNQKIDEEKMEEKEEVETNGKQCMQCILAFMIVLNKDQNRYLKR